MHYICPHKKKGLGFETSPWRYMLYPLSPCFRNHFVFLMLMEHSKNMKSKQSELNKKLHQLKQWVF